MSHLLKFTLRSTDPALNLHFCGSVMLVGLISRMMAMTNRVDTASEASLPATHSTEMNKLAQTKGPAAEKLCPCWSTNWVPAFWH